MGATQLIYELSLEGLFRTVFELSVRGKGVREGGNKVFLHVTLLLVGTELGIGTLVPGVLVSTHPRGEEQAGRELLFIGASVGRAEGRNRGDLCKRGAEEG